MIALRWNNLLSERAMGACQKQKSAAIRAPLPEHIGLFPGSSVVEQLTVNQLVGGSNPSRGANIFTHRRNSNTYGIPPITGPYRVQRKVQRGLWPWR